MSAPDSALQFREVSKYFPGVVALDAISFEARPGTVHALIGENGAGKSTLLKVLSGAHQPTTGDLLIKGRPTVFRSTAEALAAGVAVIYQELQLIPDLTVAENIFLGHMPRRYGLVNRAAMHARSLELLLSLGENINPGEQLGRLPIGQRQMVEIAKALSRGAWIFAFDEPTSSLSEKETRQLFDVIRRLRENGAIVLYVSHRMEEIFELCDSVTVFRDGRHVETMHSIQGVTRDKLVHLMVGREIQNVYNYQARDKGETVFRAEGILGPGLSEPASFDVSRGEVLGLFGLVGAGRTELLRLLYGAEHLTRGRIAIEGRDVRIYCPKEAIRAGMMLCPEDRKAQGIFPVLPVLENLNISARRRNGVLIHESWENSHARQQIERLRIRTPSPQQAMMNLSGGNQQKTILARWLAENVRVMLLDEPTRGIDVGAKSEIYNIIYSLAEAGVAVIVVSSDLPEVMGISDRLMVMREGAISGFLNREEFNNERVLALALPDHNRKAA